MKLSILANHVKYFAKTINCLCRLGNEIYFECAEDGLHVKTLNKSRSMFASLIFPSKFFVDFQPIVEGQDGNSLFTCKISMKIFLQAFRSLPFIERSVEACDITLSNDGDQLIFTLKCRHALVKTYRLNYEECESLKAVYTKDLSPNKLHVHSKLLLGVLANFPTSLDEISLSVTPCKVTLSSYVDQDGGETMSTELNLSPKEFEYFQVGIDSCISFCLKDLRSILMFGDSSGTGCKMSFENGGKPIVLELSQENIFVANFVLATVCSETLAQASTAMGTESLGNSIIVNDTKNKTTEKHQNDDGNGNRSEVKNGNSEMVLNDDHVDDNRVIIRVSDVLFTDGHQTQGIGNKTILAVDSDEETWSSSAAVK